MPNKEDRTHSLKQLSCNLSLLTLNLWLCALCGCKAPLPSASGHPKSNSDREQGYLPVGLEAPGIQYSSRQRTHPASKPQLASDTAVIKIQDACNARFLANEIACMLQRRTVAPPSSSADPPLMPRPTHHVLVLSSTSRLTYILSHS